jgi:hypothetical protein
LAQLLSRRPNRGFEVLAALHRRHRIDLQTEVIGVLVDQLLTVGGRTVRVKHALGPEYEWLFDPEDSEEIRGQVMGSAQAPYRISHISEPYALDDGHPKRVFERLTSSGGCQAPSRLLLAVIDEFV